MNQRWTQKGLMAVVVLLAALLGSSATNRPANESAQTASSAADQWLATSTTAHQVATTAFATTSSTTTAATVIGAGEWIPDELRACAPLPPNMSGYRTVGSWLPTEIPEGLVLGSASTYVAAPNQPVAPKGYRSFLLAQLGPEGRIEQLLSVVRNTEPYTESYGSPGFLKVDTEPELDQVRGHPGSIARWVNRGDTYGQLVAQWGEGDAAWTVAGGARSVGLGIEAFAELLRPLQLSSHDIADPTRRLTLLGMTSSAASARTAEFTLSKEAPADEASAVRVTISSRVSGSEGLYSATGGTEVSFEVINGRPAMFSERSAMTLTADGSVAEATLARLPRSAMVNLAGRDLIGMLQSLRPADHDDPQLVGLPLPDPSAIKSGWSWTRILADPSLGYCRDW